ncbi:MAG: serine/threonine-protein kinase [Longimicrobiales bacterium]
MATDRWERIQELFGEAKRLEAPQRYSYLAQSCPDQELRTVVLEMLEAAETARLEVESKLLTQESADGPDRPIPIEGDSFGGYRVGGKLGSGGMADVYLATRADDPEGPPVALKILRNPASSAEGIRRFHREREMLSRLDHPGIAAILDDGISEGGQPYLVIEHVDGMSLPDYVTRHRVPVQERVRLFLDICESVGFAHDRQILHRDLKASNVLVTAEGRVVLLDFGIGKPVGPSDALDASTVTPAGIRLLTPANAAPEQVTGAPVSVRTDIYALGLVLYELVAGRPALNHRRISWFEWERRVQEVRPPPPSEVADLGSSDPAGVVRDALRGGVDAVILTCLEKDPAARYGSVRELAAALQSATAGQG